MKRPRKHPYRNPETEFIGLIQFFSDPGIPVPPGTYGRPSPNKPNPRRPAELNPEQMDKLLDDWRRVRFDDLATYVRNDADYLSKTAMQVAGELARERLAKTAKGDGKTERGLLRFLKKRGIDV